MDLVNCATTKATFALLNKTTNYNTALTRAAATTADQSSSNYNTPTVLYITAYNQVYKIAMLVCSMIIPIVVMTSAHVITVRLLSRRTNQAGQQVLKSIHAANRWPKHWLLLSWLRLYRRLRTFYITSSSWFIRYWQGVIIRVQDINCLKL